MRKVAEFLAHPQRGIYNLDCSRTRKYYERSERANSHAGSRRLGAVAVVMMVGMAFGSRLNIEQPLLPDQSEHGGLPAADIDNSLQPE